MEIDRSSSYPHSNHGQLSFTALRMLQDGCLKEVRFVQKRRVYPYLWEGEASALGDSIVKDFVERILLDKETYEDRKSVEDRVLNGDAELQLVNMMRNSWKGHELRTGICL